MCAIWWTALFNHIMQRPLVCGFEHVGSRCGHVSAMLFGHSVQFGFECVVGQNMFFLWLPMYEEYQNLSSCAIGASKIPWAFH